MNGSGNVDSSTGEYSFTAAFNATGSYTLTWGAAMPSGLYHFLGSAIAGDGDASVSCSGMTTTSLDVYVRKNGVASSARFCFQVMPA